MKKRNAGKGSTKLPGDGAPLVPSEIVITPNPWNDVAPEHLNNREIDICRDTLPSLHPVTFARMRSGKEWVNMGQYMVVFREPSFNEDGPPLLLRLQRTIAKDIATIRGVRDANKKKKKVKKLKLKG
jgi:hypothetical protein